LKTRVPLTRIAVTKRPEVRDLGHPLRHQRPDREGRGLLAESCRTL